MAQDHSSLHADRARSLVVIGAGAAGMFCAVNAARMLPGLKVTVLEKSAQALAKVRVSGGGRCNVTHDCADPEQLILNYPRGRHFLRKAFHHFSCPDTVQWFAERGVALKVEPDGRMFPVTNDSATIVECLYREMNHYGVELILHAAVTDVQAGKGPGGQGFRVLVADGRHWEADRVLYATGGMPRSGAPEWLTRLGHQVVPPAPSLFTFNLPGHPITALMGISLQAEVAIKALKLKETGPLLITHWGLSGPAVLRLSAWGARELQDAGYKFDVTLNLLPGKHETAVQGELKSFRDAEPSRNVQAHNPYVLPARLWAYLLQYCEVGAQDRWTDMRNERLHKLAGVLCGLVLHAEGKTTFKEEFVTAGGVRLKDIDPHRYESKLVPGLFFAGEVVDVDGITGGFNFQHAWTGGWLVASAIAGGH